MSTEELLNIEPRVLSFPFELNQQASCSIRLLNNTQRHVAFKVKIGSPKKYRAKPKYGTVLPGSTLDIKVTMQGQTESPPSKKCKDRLRIHSAVVNSGATMTIEEIRNLFRKEGGHPIQKSKLKVDYIFPTQVPPESAHEVILGWISIGFFGIIIWYLIKMAKPLIGSVVFFMMMLMVKIISMLMSNSVEDWILKALCSGFNNLLGRQ